MIDKLRSFPVAHREIIPEKLHVTDRYANNRTEQSHDLTKVRECVMDRFRPMKQAQRFVAVHARVRFSESASL